MTLKLCHHHQKCLSMGKLRRSYCSKFEWPPSPLKWCPTRPDILFLQSGIMSATFLEYINISHLWPCKHIKQSLLQSLNLKNTCPENCIQSDLSNVTVIMKMDKVKKKYKKVWTEVIMLTMMDASLIVTGKNYSHKGFTTARLTLNHHYTGLCTIFHERWKVHAQHVCLIFF